ncbi:MAG TPA: serine hydrolase [Candidatus Nanoarchaeia archaeon]|nr:serine hydrolase [Candidatus Nanoarchaeia archaeon]
MERHKGWLLAVIAIFILSAAVHGIIFAKSSQKKDVDLSPRPYSRFGLSDNFSLIDSSIAELEIDEFLRQREDYVGTYRPLRASIEYIVANADGRFGVYFEDLTFHNWIGINERELFTPASLLKVTTVSSVLKMVEEGELTLGSEIAITQDDLNARFGKLYMGEDTKMSIKQLIEVAIRQSDNTAIRALYSLVPEERWIETRLAMGLPVVSIAQSEQGTTLTPKEFSNVFRSLYFSGYLRRQFSNWLLSLMADTGFSEGIPAGVPEGIKVSHKIGVWVSEGSMHDCGIVYAHRPYILCIMSKDTSIEEGNKMIERISHEVYQFVSESGK